MAVGDTYYKWIFSGSISASADTAHLLYGTYGGLSDLNAATVLHVQLQASGADFMLLPNVSASAYEDGQYFKEDINAYIDLPAMTIADASSLHVKNLTAGDNAVARWVLWGRYPI